MRRRTLVWTGVEAAIAVVLAAVWMRARPRPDFAPTADRAGAARVLAAALLWLRRGDSGEAVLVPPGTAVLAGDVLEARE